jgi:uncharacterized protein (TIGR02271 family)
MFDTTDLKTWEGRDLIDADGDKIGSVDEIYLDDETGQPEFALVKSGLFGATRHFVPLRDAAQSGNDLTVPYSKDKVKDAPSLDAAGHLSREDEAALYRYYGLEASAHSAGTDRQETGRRPRGGDVDDAMTRSEEELRVGTREEERGRVRLRKYVTTENVTQTVPVKKEKVRVEREAITDENRAQAMDGPEITETVHEEVLSEEVPVVEKRVVPKERVRLEKDVETSDEQISEDVRKEQIDVDGENA